VARIVVQPKTLGPARREPRRAGETARTVDAEGDRAVRRRARRAAAAAILPVVLDRDALAVARRFPGGTFAVHAGAAGGTVVPRRTAKRVVAIAADGIRQQERKQGKQDAVDAAKKNTGNV
jgi:hypothetical protein